MYYGGIDAHKTYLTIVVVDRDGKRVLRAGRVPAGEAGPLSEVLEPYRPLDVVVETCPFWPWIHDALQGSEIGFHLAHAAKVEAIAKAKKKTDKIDAELLARMLMAGLIPEVYPKPVDQRENCRLVRHQAALVRDRTRYCNRIHNQLHQQGLQIEREKLLRPTMRAELMESVWPRLDPEQKRSVACYFEFIDELTPRIKKLEKLMEERSSTDPAAALLRSIPGIGPFRSLLLTAEILPIARFPSPKRLVGFAGLAPTIRQSGLKDPYRGRIPKGANRWVRGALVSTVPTARIATARKLCRTIHAMLRSGELWRG
jgi:transposase